MTTVSQRTRSSVPSDTVIPPLYHAGPAPSEIENRLYSVNDARRMLGGVGRTTLYKLLTTGQIEGVKIGGSLKIKGSSIRACIEAPPVRINVAL